MIALEDTLYDVAYHELGTAQILGYEEGRSSGHENHRHARDYTGHRQRKHDLAENIEAVAAEILRSLDKRVVDLAHDGVQGQYHERQELIYHTDDNSAGVAYQGDVDAERPQYHIQRAVVLQYQHPRVYSKQEVHPHRHHQKHDDQRLRAL